MTDYIRYVRTSAAAGGTGENNTDSGGSHAYASLALAEAGERGFVFSSGDTLTIICSVGSGAAADITAVYFNAANWANPPDTITVINGDGESAFYDATKYCRETVTGLNLRTGVACNFNVINLQIYVQGNFATGIYLRGAAGFMRTAIGNLVRGSGNNGQGGIYCGDSGSDIGIVNNLVYGLQKYGIDKGVYMGSGSVAIYNNTAHSCGVGIDVGGGAGSNFRIFNNIANGNTTDYVLSASPHASGNNISEDASSPNAAFRNIAVDFIDEAGDDFQSDDASVVGQGADLSADALYAFDTDRLGTNRSTFDIGCYQQAESGGSTITADGLSISFSIDTGAASQAHSLLAADIDLQLDVDIATLNTESQLNPADLDFTLNLDATTCSVSSNLSPDDLQFGMAIDVASLLQSHLIPPADIDIPFEIEASSTVQAGTINAAPIAIDLLLDASAVQQAHTIAAQGITIGLALASVSLSQKHSLIATDLMFALDIDSTVVTIMHQIVAADLSVQVVMASSDVSQDHTLSAQSISISLIIDKAKVGESVLAEIDGRFVIFSPHQGSLEIKEVFAGTLEIKPPYQGRLEL